MEIQAPRGFQTNSSREQNPQPVVSQLLEVITAFLSTFITLGFWLCSAFITLWKKRSTARASLERAQHEIQSKGEATSAPLLKKGGKGGWRCLQNRQPGRDISTHL